MQDTVGVLQNIVTHKEKSYGHVVRRQFLLIIRGGHLPSRKVHFLVLVLLLGTLNLDSTFVADHPVVEGRVLGARDLDQGRKGDVRETRQSLGERVASLMTQYELAQASAIRNLYKSLRSSRPAVFQALLQR